jgi:hypothetical protein
LDGVASTDWLAAVTGEVKYWELSYR